MTSVSRSGRTMRRFFAPAFSGNYSTGGDTLDFSGDANGPANPDGLPAALAFSDLPSPVLVHNLPGGYTGQVIPGAALNAYKLQLFSASGTELAAAAYPAAFTGTQYTAIEAISPVSQ